MNENQDLEQFIDQIIKEKNLPVSDSQILADVKEDLMNSLDENINAMIIANIPTEKIDELDKLTDDNNLEAISAFIAENVPDLQTKLTEVLISFRKAYLG